MKKLNLNELALELEVISEDETRKIVGGGYYDDPAFEVYGENVTIYESLTFDNSDLFNVYGGGNWYPGNISGSSGSGAEGINNQVNSFEIAQAAISSGLAWNNFYNFLDAARLGRLEYSAAAVIREVVDTNVVQTLMTDLKAASEFKGVGILSSAGKLLGITSAANSLITLGIDIFDGGGIDTMNIVDAGISMGSLVIKSNAVGFAVSAGWLLVRGEFE